MILVYIKEELKPFEADIRDLCLAFFSMQKIKCIVENDDSKIDIEENKVEIRDFYCGNLTGDRLKDKSEIKRQLYKYLSKLTKKKLLWGTLTGIRPVTIVTKLLEEYQKSNDYENEIKNELKNEYYISNKKVNELIDIANREIKILNRNEMKEYKNSYSIYVGVPFCKTTCLYCSFTSFNIDKYSGYVKKYLDTLENEFKKELHWPRFAPSKKNGNQNIYSPKTLYIGGGTPTSLSNEDFESLLTMIDKYIYKDTLLEYTVEAGRPDTITKEKLLSMKNHGVTRISINPQTFNQKTLDLIGRKHTTKDVIDKYYLARELGFDNINMDIILGLPNEHLINVLYTLYNLVKLKPDSITIHSLALKRAARLNYELASWTKNYFLAGVHNEKEMNRMFDICDYVIKKLKLNPYYLYRQKNMAGNLENVGYATEGKENIYNIMMMSERHTVYGFGTATTKEVFYENGGKRVESTEGYKSVIDYCKNMC